MKNMVQRKTLNGQLHVKLSAKAGLAYFLSIFACNYT
jgi:hypothetical protein